MKKAAWFLAGFLLSIQAQAQSTFNWLTFPVYGTITAGDCVKWQSGNGTGIAPSVSDAGSVCGSSPYSLTTAAISPSAQDRNMLFAGQEASVFLNNGVYNVLYTDGSGYTGWRYCNGDPTLSSCWSSETVVIGNSNGGQTGTAKHGFTFFDPATPTLINQYYVDSSNNTDVATATIPVSGTTAPTFTKIGAVLPVQGGNNSQGNMSVLYSAGTYYMWQESLWSTTNPTEGNTHSWQIGVTTASTSTGTFSSIASPLSSIRVGPNAGDGGPFVTTVGSTAVMIYHCQPWGRMVVSDICRATIPLANVGTDGWTVTNGGVGNSTNEVYPFWMHRAAFLEYDQLADPTIFSSASGVQYLMYTAAKNNGDGEGSGWFYQMITPLLSGGTQTDGAYTHNIYGFPGDNPRWWNPAYPDFYTNQAGLTLPVATGGTWSSVTNTSQNGGILYTNTSAASSDQATWRVSLLPGTYTISVSYATGPGNGIAEFQIYDCVNHVAGNIVNVDGYAASAAYNANATGTLYILGYEPIKGCVQMNVNGKNASSTGYQLQVSGFSLQRTGQ